MIPKKIHYCWFGGNPLPRKAKKCIASWKKYCPDYEIIEWNESNFDINCCDYVREAYEAKKWAFVSDYARFKILYEHGGVYFDVDVELVRPIDDILAAGAFMGVEQYEDSITGIAVNPGLGIAVDSGTEIYQELLNGYHQRHFYKEDGTPDLLTIVTYTTNVLKEYGLTQEKGIQYVGGIHIYPPEYFNPYDMNTGVIKIGEYTYSIHRYAGSWVDGYSKFRGKIYRTLRRIFGENTAEKVKKILGRKR